MVWRRSGDKLLSERMMVTLLTHICVSRPQWVNTITYTAVCITVPVGGPIQFLRDQNMKGAHYETNFYAVYCNNGSAYALLAAANEHA